MINQITFEQVKRNLISQKTQKKNKQPRRCAVHFYTHVGTAHKYHESVEKHRLMLRNSYQTYGTAVLGCLHSIAFV